MKIKDIKTFPINVANGSQLVVKVETDNGIYGWGASGLSGRELAVVGAIEHYKKLLVGADVFKIGAHWQAMYRGQYFEGGRVLSAAISAIDIALYDIKGKALGVPVYELLGGRQRDYVDCFASVRFTDKEELFQFCKTCVAEGWKVLRLAPAEFESKPDRDTFEPLESITLLSGWLIELRKELGPSVIIGLDYHTRLSPPETSYFMNRMPKGTLDFLEEPIRDESPVAYESLRTLVDVPFAIGEEFSSKWQFQPFLERNLTQYARIDVCNVGGLTESMKVAAMAETHYIDLMPHNPLGPICTAATIHLAAAVPNFGWMEEINTPAQQMGTNDTQFYPVQPRLEGARYPVPDTPGLGVDFDESHALQHKFEPIEIPRLKRGDGSLTNW
ncbi:mandelate racemase/muconate lactonizing enzyme family protein [Pseudozobellia thermophila]|uniref:Galactonate dehydratase n=1 Tax=Pseudozobellia thermophila TaxID=192903 RepID=A0A1M6GGL0_9FLAO|nr:mandelate racemase/muconate lactonizing enzyme family protein [Pseudozobellia thermophila]SHJ09052.1 galactonate dehydratase [Pseudozobellia thermophila]